MLLALHRGNDFKNRCITAPFVAFANRERVLGQIASSESIQPFRLQLRQSPSRNETRKPREVNSKWAEPGLKRRVSNEDRSVLRPDRVVLHEDQAGPRWVCADLHEDRAEPDLKRREMNSLCTEADLNRRILNEDRATLPLKCLTLNEDRGHPRRDWTGPVAPRARTKVGRAAPRAPHSTLNPQPPLSHPSTLTPTLHRSPAVFAFAKIMP